MICFIDVFYCLIGSCFFVWCFSHRLSPMFQNLDCKSPVTAVIWKYLKDFKNYNISHKLWFTPPAELDCAGPRCFQETQMEVETSIAWGSLSAGTVATRPYKALYQSRADWQRKTIGEEQDKIITLQCDRIFCKALLYYMILFFNLLSTEGSTDVFLGPTAFSVRVQTMKEK